MIFGDSLIFNGVSIDTYNLQLVDFTNNSFNDALDAGLKLNIKTEQIGINPINKLLSLKYDSTLELQCTFISKDSEHIFTQEEVRNISKWLFVKDYKKLTIDNSKYKDMYFNCIVSNLQYVTNADNIVGFVATFTCDAPYGWTDFTETKTIVSSNTSEGYWTINNTSDDFLVPVRPVISVTQNYSESGALGAPFYIKRYVDGKLQEQMALTVLRIGETVTFDSENMIISSNIDNGNFYTRFNKVWTKLENGENTLAIVGMCTVTIRCRFARKVGL